MKYVVLIYETLLFQVKICDKALENVLNTTYCSWYNICEHASDICLRRVSVCTCLATWDLNGSAPEARPPNFVISYASKTMLRIAKY